MSPDESEAPMTRHSLLCPPTSPPPPPRVRGLRPSAGSRTGTAVVRHRFSGGPHQRRVLRPCVLGVRRMPVATPVCPLLFILRPPRGGCHAQCDPVGLSSFLGAPNGYWNSADQRVCVTMQAGSWLARRAENVPIRLAGSDPSCFNPFQNSR